MRDLYEIGTMEFKDLKKYIELPSFQRSVVWSIEKKEEFIDTVLKGFPFGSLLLYKSSPSSYLLVDGLQRFTTLDDFSKNPFKYIKNYEDEFKEYFDKIIGTLAPAVTTNFTIVKTEITESIKANLTKENKTTCIVNRVISDVSVLNVSVLKEKYTEYYGILSELIESIKDKYQILNKKIPYVCYSGDEDCLPQIFERLNANGTVLSKYEIYAAKWSHIIFNYNDPSILKLVDEKYQKMVEDTGVEIQNYQDGQVMREQKVNLFEFCFAFGRLIYKDNPYIIFKKQKFSTSDVASIGFSLLSVILTKTTSSLSTVANCFADMSADKIKNLIKLKELILTCLAHISKILCKYIMFPDNKNSITKYIEHQILCIVGTYFNMKYSVSTKDFSITEKTGMKKLETAFEKNMPMRYLYEILSGYWSGSGDTKIADELSKDISDNRYLTPIPLSTWERFLHDWMLEQTQKSMKNTPTENKLFLCFLLRMRKSNDNYINSKPLNVELVISKSRFTQQMKTSKGICAIGNLCVLPQFEVHSKQEYTLYEAVKNRSLVFDINDSVINDFLYPEESELLFLDSDFTEEKYLSFLKNRHDFLINRFKETLRGNV